MVSGVVLAHGGAVVVHSRPGEGTCFELVLPVAEGAANRPDSDIVPARPGRLLLVDDDPDFGEMLLNALERSGFSVTFCLDPRDALARVRREPAAFDALVTDQIMPHLSGTEIIRHVRSVRGDLPCIICTGYAEELLNHRELAEVGVYALLRKPMNVREMVTTVTHALTRGSAGDRTRLN
jgi:CheY-like chemotaxis protein